MDPETKSDTCLTSALKLVESGVGKKILQKSTSTVAEETEEDSDR